MTKQEQIEELSKELIAELGRETVDKFIEDDQGNLEKIVTYSLAAIAENLYNKGWRKEYITCSMATAKESREMLGDPKTWEPITFTLTTIEEQNELKKTIRKETAKEILQTLYNNNEKPQFMKAYIKTLADKYGVEVEE